MVLRWQFPVRPATARTFRHNQGLTLREGAVNFRGPKRFSKMAGRHYVEYNRFSNPEGHLFVLDSACKEIYVDPRVHVEMKRLREFSKASPMFAGLQQDYPFPSLIQYVLHNTRSLSAHIDDIRSDSNLLAADILIFTEARMQASTPVWNVEIPGFGCDYGEASTTANPVNVIVYQKDRDPPLTRATVYLKSCSDFTLRYDMFIIAGLSDYLHLVTLYRSPRPATTFAFFWGAAGSRSPATTHADWP
jgi:hypothetical protein